MISPQTKFALITGATNGIGKEIAKLFAKDGCNLVIVARHEDDLRQTAREITEKYGVQVVTLAKNLFDPNAAREIYDEVKSRGLEVTALVNDAGQGEYGEFADTDLDRELDMINLNIVAPVTLTKLFLQDMLDRRSGKILQISSLLGRIPSPLMAVYSATKAFIYSFSQSVINEIKDSGVTMTVLLPGATDTDFFHKAGAENTKEYVDKKESGKIADPADVAKDGYKALMNGESKIVSGMSNKMMEFLSNLTSDQALAEKMHSNMEEKK